VDGGVEVGGRLFSAAVLERIRTTVREEPELTRAALSRGVCEWLAWKRPNGKWGEMSCRVALLKLAQRGVISLPAPRCTITRRPESTERGAVIVERPIASGLSAVGAVELVRVTGGRSQWSRLWKAMVSTHHYLGYQPLVGAQLRYLIRSECGWLGAISFSAAAWQLAARDRFIGWSAGARRVHLPLVVCNSRFLLLPWVQVPNLASKVLALAAACVRRDWPATYGYQPVLLETYVESARFTGGCYRAANWVEVGTTNGRGRQDARHEGGMPVKKVFLYPLCGDWRERLCAQPPGPTRQRSLWGRREPIAAEDWAEQEFGSAPLRDRRLQRRLVGMAHDFYARPQANLPQACGTRAKTKAAYRLLDHDSLTLPQLLAAHYQSTVARMAAHPVVLAVQDTTTLSYSLHRATEGLGPTTNLPTGARGLLVHDTMAFTVEGLPVGLLDVQVWARDPRQFGKTAKRRAVPIEQKESRKWLRSFEATAIAQRELPGTVVVSVGDREADLYDLFELARRRPDHPQLLIRAEQDRLLRGEHAHLWEAVRAAPVAGTQEVRVPRRPGRPARVARLAVRFAPVELRAPSKRPHLAPVRLWAVLAEEIETPTTGEPLAWMLLTTLEVRTVEAAVEKLQWYAQRWQIEVYHRTLKSGCRIEERQLATAQRLENCLAIDMVVAWRLMHLTRLGRETPEGPCTIYFDDYQWKALHGFIHRAPTPPATPPTLREAIRMVASLGGFLGRKSDGEPGPKSMWLGLQRLDDIAAAWQIFSPLARPP
jgi:hypothetical protein